MSPEVAKILVFACKNWPPGRSVTALVAYPSNFSTTKCSYENKWRNPKIIEAEPPKWAREMLPALIMHSWSNHRGDREKRQNIPRSLKCTLTLTLIQPASKWMHWATRPHFDAILICFELPPLIPPRWFPFLTSPSWRCSPSLHTDDLDPSWTPEPPSATHVEVYAGDPFV